MMICLKRSKTDPFGGGFTLHLGRTVDDLCPIAAVLGYLARRPPDLFLFQDGTSLSRAHLCHKLRLAFMTAGVHTTWYSGHSFHIEAATTAAQVGHSSDVWPMEGCSVPGIYPHQPVNLHQCVSQTCH